MAEEIKNETDDQLENTELEEAVDETSEEENLESETEEKSDGQNNFLTENPFAIQLGIAFLAISLLIVLLVGIFSGVSFSTIIWRLISFGTLFFILGFGIGFLLKMFVPEIMDIQNQDLHEEGLGENIDYVTDEDDEVLTHSPGVEDGFDQEQQLSSGSTLNVDIDGKSYNIDNDPETQAKAIKTMLHRDDSSN